MSASSRKIHIPRLPIGRCPLPHSSSIQTHLIFLQHLSSLSLYVRLTTTKSQERTPAGNEHMLSRRDDNIDGQQREYRAVIEERRLERIGQLQGVNSFNINRERADQPYQESYCFSSDECDVSDINAGTLPSREMEMKQVRQHVPSAGGRYRAECAAGASMEHESPRLRLEVARLRRLRATSSVAPSHRR